jgi:hypothetical protein
MIRYILRKDWLLLWPMVVLVAAIQAGLEWASFGAGLFDDNSTAIELLRPLMLAWYFGIAALTVAVVQLDAVPGVDQDWLIRPLKRGDLLLAKVLFLLLTVCLPMFAFDLTHAMAMGFPPVVAANALLGKEIFLFMFFVIPALALAATTRNMPELSLLCAALIVAYAASSAAGGFVLGVNRCPTCDSGLSWLQHLLQHIGVFCGALVILALQYFRRRTAVSRAIALFGAVVLVFAQLPWHVAFAIQELVSGVAGTPITVTLTAVPDAVTVGARGFETPPAAAAGRRATRALLRGDVDQAMQFIRGISGAAASAALDVPILVSGVSPDELLLVDRAEVQMVGDAGRLLYRGINIDEITTALNPPVDGATVHQLLQIPRAVLTETDSQPVMLRVEYSLTLMKTVARHKLAALDGAFRSGDMGLCGTRLEQDTVALRCKQIGEKPFCYSATLYGPEGQHNPTVLKCRPDYRTHVPNSIEALNYEGVDLPVHDRYGLAHYAVGSAEVNRSYVLVTVYGQRGHFYRTLVTAAFHVATR